MTVCGEKVTGVCVIGKCPHIKRCCPVVWDKYGKIKPKTNEEWLCQLSTEEKAEWLSNRDEFIYDCGQKGTTPKIMDKDEWAKWLKEVHK